MAKSDAYIIKRASEIVGAVRNCGCTHCLELLEESKNAGAGTPATTSTDADIPDGQSKNDYADT